MRRYADVCKKALDSGIRFELAIDKGRLTTLSAPDGNTKTSVDIPRTARGLDEAAAELARKLKL